MKFYFTYKPTHGEELKTRLTSKHSRWSCIFLPRYLLKCHWQSSFYGWKNKAYSLHELENTQIYLRLCPQDYTALILLGIKVIHEIPFHFWHLFVINCDYLRENLQCWCHSNRYLQTGRNVEINHWRSFVIVWEWHKLNCSIVLI